MELSAAEKMLLEILQEKDAEAQKASQARTLRFLASVSERTGIPVDVLVINPQTGAITDARIVRADRSTDEQPEVLADAQADPLVTDIS